MTSTLTRPPAPTRPERVELPERLRNRRGLVPVLPVVIFLLLVFIIPLVSLFILSFRGTDEYSGTLDTWTTSQYQKIFTDRYFYSSLLHSLQVAGLVTVLCAVLAYPVALIMAKETNKVIRTVTFLVVISPLLTSVVVRSYGWRILLSSEGPVNSALLAMGFIEEPLNLLTSEAAVVMSILHVLLPFAIITLATSIGAIDNSLYRASASLGGSPIRAFFRVTVPMSLPGLLGGAMIVFSLALGIYVTPLLVGGGNQSLVGLRIYEQVMRMFNQPIGAAFSFVLLACALVVVIVLSALSKRWEKRFNG